MRLIITISRIVVGSLFIVSGLIKMNDALGFMYKLEEYFEPGALNMEWLAPYALPLAVFIVIAEVLLGVALLVGALPKLTSSLTLVLMLFFTWLTFYTHTCDPLGTTTIINEAGVEEVIANQCVLECGCFGNAIPLTPYESFLKDVFLLIFVIPIFIGAWLGRIKLNEPKEAIFIYAISILITAIFSMVMLDWLFPPLFTAISLIVAAGIQRRVSHKSKEWIMALGILVVCGITQYRTLAHLPMKDYRPYAIGQNILDNMKSAEELGKEPPEYATEYTFRNVNTKQDTMILSTEWLKIYNEDWFKNNYEAFDATDDKPGTYDGPEVKIKDGYEPLIVDLELMTYDGLDMTYDILEDEGYVFLQISNTLGKTEESAQDRFNTLARQAGENGHRFFAVTNASYDEAETYRHKHEAAYPFLNCDQTELKIIVRSNPGLVLIKNGVVIEKWAWRDVPTWSEAQEIMK
ncbi:DoxX family protein [Sanyastnella coralliicola]|uniref:DoxX family protein n=1 Tax=Sanyastnella coralliicola TaxID=3069118 RepID=UPI0027BA8506|nr:DoxX family protein [Longitalea sp. SCSIO 12813]